MKLPSAKSKGEETLARDMAIDGLPFVRQYRFHAKRKWTADFALIHERILIEVEGMGGRHQTMEGFRKDAEKYLEATKDGWIVIRCTTEQACNGKALEAIHCMRARIQNGVISNG